MFALDVNVPTDTGGGRMVRVKGPAYGSKSHRIAVLRKQYLGAKGRWRRVLAKVGKRSYRR